MAIISEDDLIQSLSDALQFISYYHPADYIQSLTAAYNREQSPSARNAMAQILVNSRMAAVGRRPICQDTGTVNIFVALGIEARINSRKSLQAIADIAVELAWKDVGNPLRASMIKDPLFDRKNTGTNGPAMVHVDIVEGGNITIHLAAKGGGSENKARFAALEPSDDVADWVVRAVSEMGAGWCPPGIIGIGVGGTAERAMLLAKTSLLDPIDMPDLLLRGPSNPSEALRIDLYERINALGIGAQGLGGLTTVLDVKLKTFATHAASRPVGLVPQCAADRHVAFTLDGSGPADLQPPSLSLWPQIDAGALVADSTRVNLDTLDRAAVAGWTAGQRLLLTGTLFTARDAAHKRLIDMLDRAEALPVNLQGKALYYVGPVDAVGSEAVGPAGPTTATRMDTYTPRLLAETGLLVMIGKAERGPEVVQAIKASGSPYLIAIGGAAYLVSKAIRSARVVAFADLGMEAIYQFEVVDMPVTVAVDCKGQAIHELGPALWRKPAR